MLSTNTETKSAPVSPYDDSLWDRNSMYDRMPFVWDPDLNTEMVLRKLSGNVIKAYRCKIDAPIEVKHE